MITTETNLKAINFDNIPKDLKSYPNWTLWKAERKRDSNELSKVPYQIDGKRASSTNYHTWTSYDNAKEAYLKGDFSGLFFALSDNEPYSVLDLDGLTRDDKRQPSFNVGFVEKTPSGKGIHVWFNEKLPDVHAQKRNNVEFYQSSRFITVTGDSNNLDKSVSEYPNDLVGLKEYLLKFGFGKTKTQIKAVTGTNEFSDDELINKIKSSAQREKFDTLFSGDYSDYSSQSEGDLALCNILAYWTNKDPEQIDSIFRESGFMRDKWDKKDGKSTYGYRTINKAIAGTKFGYDPHALDNHYQINLEDSNSNGDAYKASNGEVTYSYDDTGNSQRMQARFGKRYKYVGDTKKIMMWDGKRWIEDNSMALENDFNKVVYDLKYEKLHIPDSQQGDDQDDLVKEAKKARGRFIKRSRQHAGKVGALAEFKNLIALSADSFDQDNSVINTPLGTWHVEEKKVTPHNRKDLITKITSGTPEQSHDCPKWKKFINETFEGDKDVIQFMQRAIGYSLLGDNRDRKMFVLHGVGEEHNGSNGKSLFVETIAHVLNDYATVMSPSSLIKPKYKKDGGEATPDLVALKDKRFVYTSELNTDDQIDEAKLKEITGDRAISTRALYDKEKRSLKKTFTIFMVTNHKPTISGTEGALWDRVIFVPFAHWVSSKEANTNLFNEFVEEETNGILNWIYEGANDYLKQGLNIPQTIISNGQQYKKDQDVLGEFVDECLQFDDLQIEWTSTRDIKNACQKWLTQNHKPFSDITKYLGERYKAYAKRKKSSRGYYAKLNDLSVPFHIVSKAVQK